MPLTPAQLPKFTPEEWAAILQWLTRQQPPAGRAEWWRPPGDELRHPLAGGRYLE